MKGNAQYVAHLMYVVNAYALSTCVCTCPYFRNSFVKCVIALCSPTCWKSCAASRAPVYLSLCQFFPSQGKFRIHIVQKLHRILFRSRSSKKWNILMMIERTNCQLLVTTHIHSQLCYVIAKCSQSKSGWLYYIKDAWEIKPIRSPLHKHYRRRVKDYLTLSCIQQSHYVIFDKVPGSKKTYPYLYWVLLILHQKSLLC